MAVSQVKKGSRIDFGANINGAVKAPQKKAEQSTEVTEEKSVSINKEEIVKPVKKASPDHSVKEEKQKQPSAYEKKQKRLETSGKVEKTLVMSKELQRRAENAADALGTSLNAFIVSCIEQNLENNKAVYEQIQAMRANVGLGKQKVD